MFSPVAASIARRRQAAASPQSPSSPCALATVAAPLRLGRLDRPTVPVVTEPAFGRLLLCAQLIEPFAGAKTGIGETLICQTRYCLAVLIKMLGLPAHWSFPLEAKPAKVFQDRFVKFGPATRNINILDAQTEVSAARPGKVMGGKGGISVPRMEKSRGARRESGPDLGLHSGFGRQGDRIFLVGGMILLG